MRAAGLLAESTRPYSTTNFGSGYADWLQKWGSGGQGGQPVYLNRSPARRIMSDAPSTLIWQWGLVGLLLVLCLAKGVSFVHGLVVPPDEDMVRDISFIQATLDGNVFGDPTNFGALRWYPPLVHIIAAGLVWLSGSRIMPFWINAGPWLNLLSPLRFFLMNRRLIGPWPAVAATAVFVLFNSAAMPSDAAVGYTPFSFTPSLAWPMFFGAVWLIHARADAARFGNALLIGEYSDSYSWLTQSRRYCCRASSPVLQLCVADYGPGFWRGSRAWPLPRLPSARRISRH
jgi:hypothetical protein